MKKPDKNQNKSKKERQHLNNAKGKLELREYLDDHLRDLKRELQDDFDRIDTKVKDYKKELLTRITWIGGALFFIFSFIGFDGVRRASQLGVDQIQKQISNRLDEEFQTEEIQGLIEAKAKEYTEKESREYISKIITPFQEKITNAVDRANLEVENINDLFGIFIIAYNAQNGLRSAYIQLKDIANQQTEHGNIAKSRLIEIQKRLSIYQYPPTMWHDLTVTIDGKEIPFKELSIDEVVSRMENPYMPDGDRSYCMRDILNRPKNDVFKKALEVLTTSESITTCAAFMGVLSQISDNKARFLDFDGWIKICREELKNM